MASPDEFYISSLVKAAQNNSSDAFCQLFAATFESQYGLSCCLLGGDSERAADAVREAYTAAFSAIGELKDSGTFIPELNRLNLQICCSLSVSESDGTGFKNISYRQILALPGNEGPAFVLTYIHGLGEREICNLLNIGHIEFDRCLRLGRRHLGCGLINILSKGTYSPLKPDPSSAETLLAEILELCDLSSAAVSFKDLEAYSSYRKERFGLQKALILVLLTAFFAAPVLFISPDISIVQEDGSAAGEAAFSVTVDSLLPVKSVNASMDSGGLSVRQTGKKSYQITTDESGELKVSVKLVNGQYRVVSTDVSINDTEPPKLISQRIEDGKVIIEVEDDFSGIDYEGVYEQETGSGLIKYPLEWGDGYIVFPFPKEKTNAYIPDFSGNTLLVVLNLIK